MLILGLLGMYFDAVVVFVTSRSLLFRLAKLWTTMMSIDNSLFNDKGVKIRLEWLRQLTRAIQCLFKETFWTKKGNFESFE